MKFSFLAPCVISVYPAPSSILTGRFAALRYSPFFQSPTYLHSFKRSVASMFIKVHTTLPNADTFPHCAINEEHGYITYDEVHGFMSRRAYRLNTLHMQPPYQVPPYTAPRLANAMTCISVYKGQIAATALGNRMKERSSIGTWYIIKLDY
jgi:hypothetical protein